ncbi:uncharacterized protein LOC134855242 [Symsagittifera roscoffensis]|uniref:uncharacterized protein LOC134855242 n=1 Tax=Symsagittifera roscoffensis TaxID=84072 RepID=UPI00307C5221
MCSTSICEIPSTNLWIVLLAVFSGLPLSQIVIGILYERHCNGESESYLVVWNLVSGVLLLLALLMELVYSCTMRVVLYYKQNLPIGGGVEDGGGKRAVSRHPIVPRRVVYYPAMVVIFQIALGVSSALGLYSVFKYTCTPFLNSFTTAAVYSHLLAVLTLPPFCCVSYSWHRAEEEDAVAFLHAGGSQNSLNSNQEGRSSTSHFYERTTLSRNDNASQDNKHDHTKGARVFLRGVKMEKNKAFRHSAHIRHSSSIDNMKYQSASNGPSTNNPPISAMNPNYTLDAHNVTSRHRFNTMAVTSPQFGRGGNIPGGGFYAGAFSNPVNSGHYENIDARLAYLAAQKDVVGGVSVTHRGVNQRGLRGLGGGIYAEDRASPNHYLTPQQINRSSTPIDFPPLSSLQNNPVQNMIRTGGGSRSTLPFPIDIPRLIEQQVLQQQEAMSAQKELVGAIMSPSETLTPNSDVGPKLVPNGSAVWVKETEETKADDESDDVIMTHGGVADQSERENPTARDDNAGLVAAASKQATKKIDRQSDV